MKRLPLGLSIGPSLSFWKRRHLPVLLQTEVAECGVACVAMIASYWGHQIDLACMRRRFLVSLKGVALRSLISVARNLGLHSRPVKLDLQRLDQLKLPCVLHWDMNHFVVLQSVGRKSLVVHDPAVGRRKLSLGEASKHFTGVALELIPSSDFKITRDVQIFSLRSLMGRAIGLNRGLTQILVLGIALQACVLSAPFYLQWLVDNALVAGDRDLITVLGLGFLLLSVVQVAIGVVRSWLATVLSTDLNFQWLGNAFSHLMSLPLPYFEKRHIGDVVSRFGSIQAIQQTVTTQFVEAVIDGLLVLGTLTLMLLYSWQLTVVAAISVFLYAAMRWSIFQGLRDATAEQIVQQARQETHFIESVRGAQAIRLYGRRDERRIGWMNLLAGQFNAELRTSRLSISHQTANALIFSLERIVVIWLAALAVLESRLSVGMLFAYLSYKDQFSQRLTALVDKLFELKMLRLHGERVADILLHDPEQEGSGRELAAIPNVPPMIELRDVSFRYADGEPNVLQNVNLTIPTSQSVAITGPSGCGKTTLAKIILGLLQPTEGAVLVAGTKLAYLGLESYRQIVGTVMQDDHLFSGSLAENISFFDPTADQEQVERCAQLAAIHGEISGMAMGYNTLVGDSGGGLSGGQKQRILLARALYKDPKILVLDEATSHLDIDNERLVNNAIQRAPLTRILIAHRPETIAMAQRVVVLAQGAVVGDTTVPPQSAAAAFTPAT